MAPGLVDDAATKRAARGARRRPRDPRPLGAARRRGLRDRRAGAGAPRRVGERRRARAGRRRARSARSSSRRTTSTAGSSAPDLRERVIAFDARGLGRRPGRDRRRRPARARSGRSWARCGPGVVRTLVTDVATAEAVVALDAETLGRRRAARSDDDEPAVLGIDLGTTEVKAGLVDLDGRLLAHRPGRLRPRRSATGRAGRNRTPGRGGPRWSRAVRALRPPEPVDIVAIGVDGHGPTLVAVDDRGRGDPAGDHLARHAGRGRGRRSWRRRPASAAGRSAGLPAALWMERHEPAVAAATRWYLTTWEWLAFRLTGEAVAPPRRGPAVPDRRPSPRPGVHADRRPPADRRWARSSAS